MKRVIYLLVFLLIARAAFAQFIAIDPTKRCINARVLGMGRAFVGLADDASAVFLNPAGLARHNNWEVTSMSGKFLDDYSYLSVSGLYPTRYGNFGLAYGGYTISGAYVTKQVDGSDPNDPIYEIDYSAPPMSNNNYVYNLSYATMLDRFYKGMRWEDFFKRYGGWLDKMSLGAALKSFNVGLTGGNIKNGTGSGTQMDLGLLFTPDNRYSIGLSLQNALPARMGGTLNWANNHTEGFPHFLRLGTAFQILGQKNAFYKLYEHDVKLLVDMDYQIGVPKTMPAFHIGTEWKPMDMVALRAGIDQEIEGDGGGQNLVAASNLAFGVGFNYAGFYFDYAYHSFVTLPGVANNYFSFSYRPTLPQVREIKERIEVVEPPDRLLTFKEKTSVIGAVLDPAVVRLKMNAIPVKLLADNKFQTDSELAIGKNKLEFIGSDRLDAVLETKKIRMLRLVTFPDVAQDFWASVPISLLSMQKIVSGYPNGAFKPEGNITRAEMCALLVKTKLSKDPKAKLPRYAMKFLDVSERHWASGYIALAEKDGVVKGYPDGSFKPNGDITRAEGLAMIARFAKIREEIYTDEFPDMQASHWAARIASGAKKAGVLKYLEGKGFEPERALTRAETVEMLYRTKYVYDLLSKDLLDWDNY